MCNSLHYLLMANQATIQKKLFNNMKDTELSIGQPKILDYLKENNGAAQKDIATACHIEPASLTSVLSGMEKKELIKREIKDGNRRSLYVFLTDKGKALQKRVDYEFYNLEMQALKGFDEQEKAHIISALQKIYDNLNHPEETEIEKQKNNEYN